VPALDDETLQQLLGLLLLLLVMAPLQQMSGWKAPCMAGTAFAARHAALKHPPQQRRRISLLNSEMQVRKNIGSPVLVQIPATTLPRPAFPPPLSSHLLSQQHCCPLPGLQGQRLLLLHLLLLLLLRDFALAAVAVELPEAAIACRAAGHTAVQQGAAAETW
jgi:hypothetical protein